MNKYHHSKTRKSLNHIHIKKPTGKQKISAGIRITLT